MQTEFVKLPMALDTVTPGPGFTRMVFPVIQGKLPEGIHTGGPFLSPDGREVWKPLDAKPDPTANYRHATHEAEILADLAGEPGFPKNWKVAEANGRRFLVRSLAYVVPETYEPSMLGRVGVLHIEQAVRIMNGRYWESGDPIKIAVDPDSYEPFILDLSTAHKNKNAAGWLQADDTHSFERWASEVAGDPGLVRLRSLARKVVSSARFSLDHGGTYTRSHRYVYGSPYRPMSAIMAPIPDALFVQATDADKQETGMHTWVVVPQPLEETIQKDFQLVYGWSPLQYEGGETDS